MTSEALKALDSLHLAACDGNVEHPGYLKDYETIRSALSEISPAANSESGAVSELVQKMHELGSLQKAQTSPGTVMVSRVLAQSIADLYGDMEDGNGEKCTSIAELKAAISAQPQDHFPDVGNMIPPVVSPQTSDRPTMVSLLRQLGYTVIPPKGDVSFPTAYSPCLSKSAETDTQEDLSIAPDAKSGGEASPIIGDGDPREAVINTLRLELEELHAEAKDIEEAHADDARMIDRIADLIGLPQDQELSTVAFELWFSEQRSALPTQAEVGVECERIARIIDPSAWQNYDAAIRPYAENRGAGQGEQFWYACTWTDGCRTVEDARSWMLDRPLDHKDVLSIYSLRSSLEKAKEIAARSWFTQKGEGQ